MRIAWMYGDPVVVAGREGQLWPARIAQVEASPPMLPGEAMRKALIGAVVRSRDGALSRIAGVEAFATANLSEGMDLGILLVPLAM
ncbi:MAG TPA: hypothetical protein VFQ42_22340 [Mycobacterium sp.]|nr:hypothetical protein [Mycobacterium sp.]